MLELFIGIRNMEKESTVGQMEQNLKVILKMTRRKDLGHSVFPVEIYLRFDFHYRFSVKWVCLPKMERIYKGKKKLN